MEWETEQGQKGQKKTTVLLALPRIRDGLWNSSLQHYPERPNRRLSCSAFIPWPLPHFHSLFLPSGALWINLSFLESAFLHSTLQCQPPFLQSCMAEPLTVCNIQHCCSCLELENGTIFVSEIVQYQEKTNSNHSCFYAFKKPNSY